MLLLNMGYIDIGVDIVNGLNVWTLLGCADRQKSNIYVYYKNMINK